MNLSYMRSNVKLVAIGSGVSMGYLGNSHFGLEDISIISSMPGIPIYQPSDCIELYQMVQYLAHVDGPAYLRLTGTSPSPAIHSTDFVFNPSIPDILSVGSELLVLSSGSVSSNVVAACKHLKPNLVQHINIPFYNHLPQFTFDFLHRYSQVLVVEEHSSFGGLSSVISNYIVSHKLSTKLHSAPLPPTFMPSGDYAHLLSFSGLDRDSLKDRIVSLLS